MASTYAGNIVQRLGDFKDYLSTLVVDSSHEAYMCLHKIIASLSVICSISYYYGSLLLILGMLNSMDDLSSLYLLDECEHKPYIITMVLMRLVSQFLTPSYVTIFNIAQWMTHHSFLYLMNVNLSLTLSLWCE